MELLEHKGIVLSKIASDNRKEGNNNEAINKNNNGEGLQIILYIL